MVIWFILLLCGSYILGSIPLAYLLGKGRGLDLTRSGTGQAGAGNLGRMAGSWKLGFAVGAFDFAKGAFVMWVGRLLGYGVAGQVVLGVAVMAGHDWSPFLSFRGGRGVATAIGIIVIMPLINSFTPWVAVTFVGAGLVCLVITRSTPLPVFIALLTLPISSAVLTGDIRVTLALALLAAVIVVKRLTAAPLAIPSDGRTVMVNRLLFDRDVKDRKEWMYRRSRHRDDGPQS